MNFWLYIWSDESRNAATGSKPETLGAITMNSILFIFSLFLFQIISGFGQTDMTAAGRLITTADSVILISHVSVEEYHDQRDISEYQVGDSANILY